MLSLLGSLLAVAVVAVAPVTAVSQEASIAATGFDGVPINIGAGEDLIFQLHGDGNR
jgi:hypothetical protein